MSTYHIHFEAERGAKTATMTIDKGGEDTAVSKLVLAAVGEVPPSQPFPQVEQHLRNVALQQGFDDYSLVTVENNTGNERLDKYVQRANDDQTARLGVEQREDMVVEDNEPYDEEGAGDLDEGNADADTDTDEGNGDGEGADAKPAYDDITVAQIKERLDKAGTEYNASDDKQALYDKL